MRVRPIRSCDVVAVSELLAELGYPQDGQDATGRRIEWWTEDAFSRAFVAEVGADVVGVIAVHICPFFERDGFRGRIVVLVVAGRARRIGVGARLVTAAERFAAARGCLTMEVTSGGERRDAHKFYRRRGYVDQQGRSSRFVRALSPRRRTGSAV